MTTYRSILLGGAIAFGLALGYGAVPALQGAGLVSAAHAEVSDADLQAAQSSMLKCLQDKYPGETLATTTDAHLAEAFACSTSGAEAKTLAVKNARGVNALTGFVGALAANSSVTNAELNTVIATAVGVGASQTALVSAASQSRSTYSYSVGTGGGASQSVGGAISGVGGTSAGGGGEGTIDCTTASATDPKPKGCP